jgi:hypothetical protein
LTPEDPGANCPNGGVKIEHGLDDNGDGVLDDIEVDGEAFLCNGADGEDGTDGEDGATSLVKLSAEPAGDNCANGGVRIEQGLDADGDGILGSGEVTETTFVCNGADGNDGEDAPATVFAVTTLAVGDADCANGGALVEFGGDDDASGTLETSEIDGSFALCNGGNGADGDPGDPGSDGLNSLIAVITLDVGDPACPNGGIAVSHGLDADDDGVLDPEEIEATTPVCNGADAEPTP